MSERLSKLHLPMRRGDSIMGFISGVSVNLFFMHSIVNFFKSDEHQRYLADYFVSHGPYIHANRNELQKEFLESERDWLFMVDNDMVFEPRDVWELHAVAEERGPGIYTAPYLIEQGVMVCGVWDHENPMTYHPLNLLPSKPTEIGVAGAGFTLIHRKVYEAVGAKAYSPLYEDAGEDLSFSWRAREAGFTPVLVPDSKPGHHKTVVLYPSLQVRNMIGEEVQLVEYDPSLMQEPMEVV